MRGSLGFLDRLPASRGPVFLSAVFAETRCMKKKMKKNNDPGRAGARSYKDIGKKRNAVAKHHTPARDRTENLLLRRQAPYPLGHGGFVCTWKA